TKKTRKLRASNTWAYSRCPRDKETERDSSGRKLFYCKFPRCPFVSHVTTNIRNHLKKNHNLIITEEESLQQKAAKRKWEGYVKKAVERKEEKEQIAQDQVLKDAIQLPAVREALAELIIVRKLPYTATEWPELHALLRSVNYMAKDVIPKAATSARRIVKNSYAVSREILQKKLRKA
ncbi:hypothetical protein DM02DRAFT_507587, partial [Periconia macrospinosa]